MSVPYVTSVRRDDDPARSVTVRWVDNQGVPLYVTCDDAHGAAEAVRRILGHPVLRDPDDGLLDVDQVLRDHGSDGDTGHVLHGFCPRCNNRWLDAVIDSGYAIPDPAPYVDILPDHDW